MQRETTLAGDAWGPLCGFALGGTLGITLGAALVVFFGALWLSRADLLDELQTRSTAPCVWAQRHPYSAGDLEAQREVFRRVDVDLSGVCNRHFRHGEPIEVLVAVRRQAGLIRGTTLK